MTAGLRHAVRRRVLVGDADPGIRRLLGRGLPVHDFAVATVASATAMLEALEQGRVDVVVLDAGLPGSPTSELIRDVRRRGGVSVLVLLSEVTEQAVIAALDAGADDCVRKPVSVPELGARLRRLVRRAMAQIGVPPVLRAGSLVIDCVHWQVQLDGQVVRLSVQEQVVLRCLVEEADDIVSIEALHGSLWGGQPSGQPLASTARLYQIVRSLQRKLGASAAGPGPLRRELPLGFRFPQDG